MINEIKSLLEQDIEFCHKKRRYYLYKIADKEYLILKVITQIMTQKDSIITFRSMNKIIIFSNNKMRMKIYSPLSNNFPPVRSLTSSYWLKRI